MFSEVLRFGDAIVGAPSPGSDWCRPRIASSLSFEGKTSPFEPRVAEKKERLSFQSSKQSLSLDLSILDRQTPVTNQTQNS